MRQCVTPWCIESVCLAGIPQGGITPFMSPGYIPTNRPGIFFLHHGGYPQPQPENGGQPQDNVVRFCMVRNNQLEF